MTAALDTDYVNLNRGGTPGTLGSGTEGPMSVRNLLAASVQNPASADPTTLTTFEGSAIWYGGKPYIWDGTTYQQIPLDGEDMTAPDASTSVATPDNGIIMSSDGNLWANATGAAITPSGTTDAALSGDGFTQITGNAVLSFASTGATLVNSGTSTNLDLDVDMEVTYDTIAAASAGEVNALAGTDTQIVEISDGTLRKVTLDDMPVIPPVAAVGMVVPDNAIVACSDGGIAQNQSGGTITIATGTTCANLVTDGLTDLSSGGGSATPPSTAAGTAGITIQLSDTTGITGALNTGFTLPASPTGNAGAWYSPTGVMTSTGQSSIGGVLTSSSAGALYFGLGWHAAGDMISGSINANATYYFHATWFDD